jgi:methionine-rich copper-binding protein CopC
MMFGLPLAAVTVLGALAAAPCFAHARLQSSVPANNAQLTEAPKTLTLKFDEAAQLAVLKLIGAGKEVPIAVDKADKAAATFTVGLPALAPGKYEVRWTAVSADDGHVTRGSFTFSIVSSEQTSH